MKRKNTFKNKDFCKKDMFRLIDFMSDIARLIAKEYKGTNLIVAIDKKFNKMYKKIKSERLKNDLVEKYEKVKDDYISKYGYDDIKFI